MQKYKDIPSWWFWVLLLGNTILGMIIVQQWPHIFQLPWWGVLLGFIISIVFTLPLGVLAATTNRVCTRQYKLTIPVNMLHTAFGYNAVN
jgi:hypothetical protein